MKKGGEKKKAMIARLSFYICCFGPFGRKEVYLAVTFSMNSARYREHTFSQLLLYFLNNFDEFDGVKVKNSTCYSRPRNFRLKVKR